MANTKRVDLKNIKTTFYVRMRLDHDRVLMFTDLYDSGIAIDPIILWETAKDQYELIDGRHRLEALRNGGYGWTKAEVVILKSRAEAIILALTANLGGSLPPTLGDIEHVIELLINEGWDKHDILSHLGLPEFMAKKYYKLTLSKIYKRKGREAAALVRDKNMTVEEAAKKVGIPVKEVQESLGASISRVGDKDVSAILKAFETRLRGLSQTTSKQTEALHDLYSSGEIEANAVAQYIDRVKASAKRVSRTLNDAVERLDKLIHPALVVESKEEVVEALKPKEKVILPEPLTPAAKREYIKASPGKRSILPNAIKDALSLAKEPLTMQQIMESMEAHGFQNPWSTKSLHTQVGQYLRKMSNEIVTVGNAIRGKKYQLKDTTPSKHN